MISRYFVSFNFAALITFGLFFAMQMLISNGEIVITDKRERISVQLDGVRELEPVKKGIEPPVRREEYVAPPEQKITMVLPGQPNVGPIPLGPAPKVSAPVIGDGPSAFNSEGDFIAILRPTPQYPVKLAEQGIEGYVRVRYTVTETGATANVVVISSSHKGFERSALKAAQKFKFKPRVEDGTAKAVENVYSTLEYKLEV